MRCSPRSAFTLVELLIVVAILGGLLAIVLPAIAAVRAAAQRTVCTHRQRDLARSLLVGQSRRGHFTGYVNRLGGRPASWCVMVLPDLGRRAQYEAFVSGANEFGMLEEFACPSDPPQSAAAPQLSYAVNCGLTDGVAGHVATLQVPADWRANGVFHEHFQRNVARTLVSSDYLAARDGVGHTILLGENVAADEWPGVGWRFGGDPLSPGSNPGEYEGGLLWTGLSLASVRPETEINGLAADQQALEISARAAQQARFRGGQSAGRNFARPSSRHPGGALVAMADGRIRWLSDQTPFLVYALLMSCDGRRARQPGDADHPPQRPIDEVYRTTVLDEEMLSQ